jgi:hypothetical protein
MGTEKSVSHPDVSRFDAINWVASDCLARDQEPSHRLHEPEWITTTIDPITGRDITDVRAHPNIVDGKVTMYFESERTRRDYLDTPKEHALRLPDNPDDDGEAEG